ncbi:MAG TPA: LuxR C-terminal-related transcriptional regulator [Solirubrobacteraceae bacterium]|nr:LuxR C-terminal-related transcriptional regulator [Solirubrobacteraceae bacterium]
MTGSRGETGWERLFWLVFERTSNPIALLDERRVIVQLNDAAVELFGGERERLIGTSMAESVLAAERERSALEWEQFLRTGEQFGTRDLIRADGSSVKVDFAARSARVDGVRAIYVAMLHAEHDRPEGARSTELPLTAREREVVMQIALGRDTAEIAAELHVSPETVRSHVRNAMAKLDVHTRAQLVAVVISAEHALHGERI